MQILKPYKKMYTEIILIQGSLKCRYNENFPHCGGKPDCCRGQRCNYLIWQSSHKLCDFASKEDENKTLAFLFPEFMKDKTFDSKKPYREWFNAPRKVDCFEIKEDKEVTGTREYEVVYKAYFKPPIAESEERLFTEKDMISASKYGYEYHKTSQFPNLEFEEMAINNTKQWINSINKTDL